MRPTIYVIIILMCTCSMMHAATYHIDYKNGSDANSGLKPAEAFKHCPGDPKAQDTAATVKLAAGDTLLFMGGVIYRGYIEIDASGSEGKPIVIDGNSAGTYGTGMAHMNGSLPLTSWKKCASASEAGGHPEWKKIWRCVLPPGVSTWTAGLLQDGESLSVAQYPTASDYDFNDKNSEFIQTGKGELGHTSLAHKELESLGGADLVGAYMQAHVSTNRVEIRQIEKWADKRIHFKAFKNKPYKNKGSYAIMNTTHSKVFDAPGEYVVLEKEKTDAGTPVLMIPLSGKNPNKENITVMIENVAMHLKRGNSYITLRNMQISNYRTAVTNYENFVNGTRHWNNKSDTMKQIIIEDCLFEHIRDREYGSTVYMIALEDCIARNNIVRNTFKQRGFGWHTINNCQFLNNTLDTVGRTPLIMYIASNCRIANNTISNCTGSHSNGMSVYIASKNIVVENNVIWNSNVCFTCNETDNVTIRGNVFDARMASGQPMAFWKKVNGEVIVEDNILLSGGTINSGFTIGGLGDKGKGFKNIKAQIKNNIMSGPMKNVMSGKVIGPEQHSHSNNIYLNIPEGFELGEGEKVEADLNKLVDGLDTHEYKRK
ncbi:MAG: right-handed parallel beta-helix repeat-containing protein [Planctomycetes bacterium]|nr:right-handed parallel beta-helix repeat-containing protein [Planctomycetota bacterium]